MLDLTKVFPKKLFYQGDDFTVNVSLVDYNSSSYTLKYVWKKATLAAFECSSTPNLDGSFLLSIPSATTATFTPGLYYVVAVIIDGDGKKETLGQAEIQVNPDLSNSTTFDPRSQNRKALDDVEAALASGAGSDVIEYTIGNTTVKKNRAELLKLRAFYLQRVRKEDGLASIGTIQYYL